MVPERAAAEAGRSAPRRSPPRAGVTPAPWRPLVGVARDRREPPLIRANAVGYLRFFPISGAQSALEAAAADEHAAVRAVAVLGLAEQGFSAARAVPVLTRALADPQRIVRIGAALSLVNLQVTTLAGDSGRLLEDAKRDYVMRAVLLSDDAGVMLDIGKFHLLNHRPEPAGGALDASLRLDGNLQAARYFLAVARAAQGGCEARELLGKIPKDTRRPRCREAPGRPAQPSRALAGPSGGRSNRFDIASGDKSHYLRNTPGLFK